MLRILRGKEYSEIYVLFEKNGVFDNRFRKQDLRNVMTEFNRDGSNLSTYIEVLRDIKLTPDKSLKIITIIAMILQKCNNIQQNERFLKLLQDMSTKCEHLEASFKQKLSKKTRSLNQSQQNIDSSVQIARVKRINSSNLDSFQSKQLYLLNNVVMPILNIQKKILFSEDNVFFKKTTTICGTSEVWSIINLLKKIVELSYSVEYVGRYFSNFYMDGMLQLIDVIDFDIRKLYKRLEHYVTSKKLQIEIIMEERKEIIEQLQQRRGLILMCQEIELINQNISYMYCNKYFYSKLKEKRIFIPQLMPLQNHQFDVIYKIDQSIKSEAKRSRRTHAIEKMESQKRKFESEYVEDI